MQILLTGGKISVVLAGQKIIDGIEKWYFENFWIKKHRRNFFDRLIDVDTPFASDSVTSWSRVGDI